MPRFFVESELLAGPEIYLSKEESRHAIRVLRLKNGDVVDIFDGKGGDFRAIVTGVQGGKLSLALDKTYKSAVAAANSAVEITLAISVIKPEPMDILIQKACELGASRIAPILTERTVVHISKERWDSKLGRWKKIALESCKQCGQNLIPDILPVQEYSAFVESSAHRYDLVLLPTLAYPGMPLRQDLESRNDAKRILILIGPEGDFSRDEADLTIQKLSAQVVTLGPLVLRSETAVFYALSATSFFFREFR